MSILQGIGGAPIPERRKPVESPSHSVAEFRTEAEPPDPPSAESHAKEEPVSRLLEYYRSKHSAWVAEAEGLAQLRDEVRSASDRETLEIVAQARKDVRDIIAIARQELLVLSEQVRASLGDSEPPPPVLEALENDKWLPASISRESTRSNDVHATVTLVANPPAAGSKTEDAKREADWGAEFDSLIREADDQTRRW